MPRLTNDDDRISLLRLKGYEQPEAGFTKDFLEKFHQRQRSDLVRQSSVTLWWERTLQWFSDSPLRKILIPAGLTAATAGLITIFMFRQAEEPASSHGIAQPTRLPTANPTPEWPHHHAKAHFVRVSDFTPPTSLLPAGPLDHLTQVEPAIHEDEPSVKYRLIPPPMFDKASSDPDHSLR